MPYKLKGNCVIRADTGETVKCHKTRKKALAHLAAMEIHIHEAVGWVEGKHPRDDVGRFAFLHGGRTVDSTRLSRSSIKDGRLLGLEHQFATPAAARKEAIADLQQVANRSHGECAYFLSGNRITAHSKTSTPGKIHLGTRDELMGKDVIHSHPHGVAGLSPADMWAFSTGGMRSFSSVTADGTVTGVRLKKGKDHPELGVAATIGGRMAEDVMIRAQYEVQMRGLGTHHKKGGMDIPTPEASKEIWKSFTKYMSNSAVRNPDGSLVKVGDYYEFFGG